MPILNGLRVITASTVALAATFTGVAIYSSGAPATTAVPAASAEATPERQAGLSRSEVRPEVETAAAARADTLVATVEQISQHDADLKAEAAAAAEALERFKAEQGYDPDTTSPKEIARQIAANKYGWGADQFACYDNIIMRESMWITTADNPTSSAYGIPQALPGKRMASFGDDWLTNPATQIKWGLNYVEERYGTPCKAWSFKRANGWY